MPFLWGNFGLRLIRRRMFWHSDATVALVGSDVMGGGPGGKINGAIEFE